MSKRKASARWARIGVYAFLGFAAAFFLLPLYVMLTTSFKSMEEIRLGQIFALPMAPSLAQSTWSGQLIFLS